MEIQCLGTYFNFIMGMVASSVLLTVLVLNYHHRHPDTHNMPTWVRTDNCTMMLQLQALCMGSHETLSLSYYPCPCR